MNALRSYTGLMVLMLCALGSMAGPCSCIGKAKPRAAIKSADRAFLAKVVKEETVEVPMEVFGEVSITKFTYRRYTFRVSRSIKGVMLKRDISVVTGVGHGDCGFSFTVGREYVVYAQWREQFYNDGPDIRRFLYTDICTRTTGDVPDELAAIRAER